MLRQCAIAGIAFLSGCLATAAGASDFDIIEAPEIRIDDASVAEGWYLRGDFGYAARASGGDPAYTVYQPGGAVSSRETFDTARFSEPASYGAGIGYQFSNVLRADLTASAFEGRLAGTSDVARPCAGEAAGTRCGFGHRAGYDAVEVMANTYVDLGTVMGFTPYLGAGAGATRLAWDDLDSTVTCIAGAAACLGVPQAGVTLPGADGWRFTYALTAGASYDLTETIKLDIGYRFTDVDGGRMFGRGASAASWGESGRDDGLRRHEIRAGLRIAIW